MKISEDIQFILNWQDVRMLAIYSSRWSSQFDLQLDSQPLQILENILKKLELQMPKEGVTFRNDAYTEELKEKSKLKGMKSPYYKKV